MSDPIAPSSTSASGPEMSTPETLTGIFFEPSRTFEALRARPRFLVASLILLAIALIFMVVLYTRVDMGQFIRSRIEQSQASSGAQVSEAQIDMQVRVGKMFGMAVIPLSVPVTLAAGAGLYMLGVMVFGGSITYKKALAVWAYSSLPPAVITGLIAILVLFLKAPETIDPERMIATNPGVLLGEGSSRVLVALLTQFDLVRFYGLFLAALGLRKVGKLSSGAAWGVVIALWALGTLLAVGSAAIFAR